MEYAANFVQFVLDWRVLGLLLAAFMFGGVVGIRVADLAEEEDDFAHIPKRGWAADEEITVKAAREVV